MRIKRPRTYDIPDPVHRGFTEDLYKAFNRGISYGEGIDTPDQNISGKMVEVASTGVANTEFVVIHNLGRVPLFYDVKYKSLAGDIYDSGTAWTATKAFFKCTVANVKVRLFIH